MIKLRRIKKITCPVCDDFYFSGPNYRSRSLKTQEGIDEYNEEVDEYLNGEVYCYQCGWIYDINQAENPDSKEGFNEKSVNELKIEYQKKIKENPDYSYLSELYPHTPEPHKCPVCGEYEFPDEASYDICPVCGWEDDDYFEGGGANVLSLDEAIAKFKSLREKDPNYRWEDTFDD